MHVHKVIVFQLITARTLYDPTNLLDWSLSPNALVNPDMKDVLNVSPRFWKMDKLNNKVLAMDEEERNYRIEITKRNPKKQTVYCYKVVTLPCPNCRSEEDGKSN